MGRSDSIPQTAILFEEVKGGWRWTLRDRYGETQGWEPSWMQASGQVNHVRLAHMVGLERRGEAANLEAQAPLPASVSATPEGSQRGRSDA